MFSCNWNYVGRTELKYSYGGRECLHRTYILIKEIKGEIYEYNIKYVCDKCCR